jgi:hypothetical protein
MSPPMLELAEPAFPKCRRASDRRRLGPIKIVLSTLDCTVPILAWSISTPGVIQADLMHITREATRVLARGTIALHRQDNRLR